MTLELLATLTAGLFSGASIYINLVSTLPESNVVLLWRLPSGAPATRKRP